MRHILVAAVGTLMALPTLSEAQRNDPISLRHALGATSVGTGLRIRTDDGAIYGTSSYRLVGPALVVNDTVMPPMESVTHVWRRGTHAGAGAALGGTIGGLALGALAASFAGAMCETSNCGGDTVAALGAGAAIGALGGAIVGGIVGSFVPAWKTVWQRDTR